MQKLLFLSIIFLALFSCNSADSTAKNTPIVSPATLDSIGQVDIAATIHGFYKWYGPFSNAPVSNFDFVTDDGKHNKLNTAAFNAYLAKFAATGFVSTQWVDAERAFFKECEKAWQTEILGDLPTGLDYDRIICGQDGDMDEFTTAPVKSVITENKAVATQTFVKDSPNGPNRRYELQKENGKWLITKFDCLTDMPEMEETPVVEVPKVFVVVMVEKGAGYDVYIEGKKIKVEDFKQEITQRFETWKKAGAKKMPPLRIELKGTVTMGVRGALNDIYTEESAKYKE